MGKFVHKKMQHISGISRQQLQISSLEDKIASDNPPDASGSFY